MRSVRIKMFSSAALIILLIAAVPFIGTTQSETDETEGVVLDFGYWDMYWVEMDLMDGMTGDTALDTVCTVMGYDPPVRLNDGTVYSVNE